MAPTSSDDQPTGPEPGLTETERAELERLRAEVAALRAAPPPPPRAGGRAGRTGRWVGAIALFLVGALLGCAAVIAVFVRNQVLDTDRYVATVAPLARDPALQDAIAQRITTEIVTRIDIESLVTQGLEALERQGAPGQITSLAGPISNGLQSFLYNQVRKVVGTDTFAQAWDAANRAAHQELVAVLTGKKGEFVEASDTTVSVDLGAFLLVVKDRLVKAGFTLAERIPAVSIKFTVFESSDLPRAQRAVRFLDNVATWLPWIALLLLVAGVAAAPNRRRGLLTAALFVAAGAVLLLASLGAVRSVYLDKVPTDVLPQSAAASLYDTVVRFLVAGVRTLFVLALVVAVAAFLFGTSGVARGLRRVTGRGLDAAGSGLAQTGLPLNPVQRALARYRGPIEVGVVVVAALVLLLWNRPTTPVVLWLTVVTLAVLAVIEILIRSGGGLRPTGEPSPA